MTQKQLNRGKEVQKEISVIEKEILPAEKLLAYVGSCCHTNGDYEFKVDHNEEVECTGNELKSFLESLIKTRKDKIKELEQEFEKL